MIEFLARGLLEAEDLATLRIYARHHVLDCAVLASRIHGLKNHQDRPVIRRIESKSAHRPVRKHPL